eukprot:scaffold1697_cov120-Cylindrotheca_fusiformis.AAC.34
MTEHKTFDDDEAASPQIHGRNHPKRYLTITASMDFTDPCERVRSTCRHWMADNNKSQSVSIHKENIPRLATDILRRRSENPNWIEWDEEKWHYTGDGYTGSESRKRERVALYILTLDAINFCFWPNRDPSDSTINPLEYELLAMALKKMAELDHGDADNTESNFCEDTYAFSPQNLARMTPETLVSALIPHYLDNTGKRAQLLKEVGEGLIQNFCGSATELIQAADGDASKLVESIITHFAGFRDIVQVADNEQVFFLKRAQIFVGDVNAALNLNLGGMERLTTFADYRVPQILRHFDVLRYSPALANAVDAGQEINKESADEISIRAGTVIAVEELVEYMNGKLEGETPFTDVGVDWYLWQVGERMHQDGLLKPFHKVRTHFY